MIKCEELLENWLLFSCLCLVMKVFAIHQRYASTRTAAAGAARPHNHHKNLGGWHQIAAPGPPCLCLLQPPHPAPSLTILCRGAYLRTQPCRGDPHSMPFADYTLDTLDCLNNFDLYSNRFFLPSIVPRDNLQTRKS